MKRLLLPLMLGVLVSAFLGVLPALAIFDVTPAQAQAQSDAPQVVATWPTDGLKDLDSASITEITVTFDRPMRRDSWSWVMEDAASFPEVAGDPYFTEDGLTCVLPVKLTPMTSYVIWINSDTLQNFVDENGVPATPYRFFFATLQ